MLKSVIDLINTQGVNSYLAYAYLHVKSLIFKDFSKLCHVVHKFDE